MPNPVKLLYDAECAFCTRTAQWAARRYRGGPIEIEGYQTTRDPRADAEIRNVCAHTVYLFTPDGRGLRSGRAALFILENCGWGFWAKLLSVPPFIWIVELGYRWIAANRRLISKIFFRK